jgi:hypothetical protein
VHSWGLVPPLWKRVTTITLAARTAALTLLTQPIVVESEASLRGLKAENHAQYGQDLCRVVVNAKQIRGIRAELSLLEQSGEPSSFKGLSPSDAAKYQEMSSYLSTQNFQYLVVAPFSKPMWFKAPA